MKKSFHFLFLLYLVLFIQCGLKVPATPVDQTVFVYSANGTPLQGREVNLTTNGRFHDADKLVGLSDKNGRVNFKFSWEEYHESGQWDWFIDAKPDDKTMQVNRVMSRKSPSTDTIVIDSIAPFKVRFRTKDRIHEFGYYLKTEKGQEFIVNQAPIQFTARAIDTIMTVKALKKNECFIDFRVFYSDKATPANLTPWGSARFYIKKDTPRDSIFDAFMNW